MSEKMQALQAGTILESNDGKYKILKVLGQGGFGITYLVEGTVTVKNISMKGRFALKEHFISSMSEREGVSIKVVGSNALAVSNSLKAFIKEATRLQNLGIKHDNIVKVNEVFEANNTAYYVMEYLQGETLESYVRRQGTLSADEALKFMQPIMHAVASLHANNLTHYDIKPQNIILRKDEDEQSDVCPTLIDFGLAKHYDEDGNATSTNNVSGYSEGYSPIEQYERIRQFSPWCDVYSLAATLLFCLTGKVPPSAFKLKVAEVEQELADKLNPSQLHTLLKALSKDCDNRQQSAEELYKNLYGEAPILGKVKLDGKKKKTPKSSETEIHSEKPSPWGKITAIAAVVVLLILAAIFLLPKGSDSPTTGGDKDSDSISQSTATPITPIIHQRQEEETPKPEPTTTFEEDLADAVKYLDENSYWNRDEMERFTNLEGLFDDLNHFRYDRLTNHWGPLLKDSQYFQKLVDHVKSGKDKERPAEGDTYTNSNKIPRYGFCCKIDK